MEPLIGTSATQFDARKFSWLGSGTDEVSVCLTWHASRVKTWNDMLTIPFTVGGEGSGSDPDIFSAVVRNAFGVKLKLVSGYPGTAEVALAIERGEVDGRCGWSWSSLKLTKPDWIANKRINLITQLALKKGSELPDVPLIFEFATTDRQRQILRLVLSRQSMARPFAAPPDLPEDRKEALRQAFEETHNVSSAISIARERGSGPSSPTRLRTLPEVPTSAEAGLPDFQQQGWNGLFAPKGTPDAIIARLNAALRAAVASDALQARMDDLGSIPATGEELSPDYVAKLVPAEIDKFRKLLAENK